MRIFRQPSRFILLTFLLIFACSPNSWASEKSAGKNLYLELDFDFTSGDYGSDTTTDSTVYTLLLGAYLGDRWDVQISAPYIYQNNSYVTTSGSIHYGSRMAGSPQVSPLANGDGVGGTGGDGTGGMGGTGGDGTSGMDPTTTTTTTDVRESQSGLGDMTLTLGYILHFEGRASPQVRAYAEGQLPTGDEDKGLGTGGYGVEGGLELFKWTGPFSLLGKGAYTWQEDRSDLGLKNYWSYEVGLGYALTDRLRPGLSLWGATEPAEGIGNLLEGKVQLHYRTGETSAIGAYVMKGLATASPDSGVGVFIFWNF
ncbi:MAG: transporter [Desulfuromonadales bacterium]